MSNHLTEASHAILFTSKQCPHCPAVSKVLKELNKSGKLAALDVFDIASNQAEAAHYNIRSVPWFKIAELEFQGLHSSGELAYWAEKAGSEEGILRYLVESLDAGKLSQVESLINLHPDWLNIAMRILADMMTPIQARIGLGAIIEGFANTPILENTFPALEKFSQDSDHRIRGDACHYLGFIDTPDSKKILQQCLNDKHEEVREIAEDSLANLKS